MPSCFIAISGPSGSGKTWLANALKAALQHDHPQQAVAVLSEDAYYKDQSQLSYSQRLNVNYDHPDALEHQLLIAHLRSLHCGTAIEAPIYDYEQHTRSDDTRTLSPTPVVLIEGMQLLHREELRRLFDLRIYLDTPLDCCLQRRVVRDIAERGRTEQSVRQQFADNVLPMYHRFIEPCREYASVVIDGSEITQHQIRELAERIATLRPQGLKK